MKKVRIGIFSGAYQIDAYLSYASDQDIFVDRYRLRGNQEVYINNIVCICFIYVSGLFLHSPDTT